MTLTVLVPSLYRATPLLGFILNGNLVLVWNDFIYEEARKTIHRLEVRYQKIDIDSIEVLQLLDLITDMGVKVPSMPDSWPTHSPDRDDDHFLWASIKGNAEYIISGDKRHMLSLKEFQDIPIGAPREFFQWATTVHPMD